MTGILKRTINNCHSNFGTCIKFNNKGTYLASGSVDETIKIWECK